MRNERDETVMHILSECSKLAQTEYKKRHDKSPLWFTGNYVVSMALNLPNTGTNTEQRDDKEPGHNDLVGFQHQTRPCCRGLTS